MTKADVVVQIAQKTGIEREDVSQMLETLFKVVKNNLIQGEAIYVRGFGSFTIKNERQKRAAISPKTLRFIFLNDHFPRLNRQRNLFFR